jgi:hypothetical protein
LKPGEPADPAPPFAPVPQVAAAKAIDAPQPDPQVSMHKDLRKTNDRRFSAVLSGKKAIGKHADGFHGIPAKLLG